MKDKYPFIVIAKLLERGIYRAPLPESLLILKNRKLRYAVPRIDCKLGRIVHARIIANKYPAKPRNTRTRLNRTQCLDDRSGRIEGWNDYRCVHATILAANYFSIVIQDLIPNFHLIGNRATDWRNPIDI